jgi:molybdopterin synthase catalytic subunit
VSTHAIVVDGRIDEAAVRAAVESDAHGAIAIFCGVVRDHDGGRSVRALDYRAHPDAERFLADIVARVHEQTGCLVAAAHRIGDLHVGDVALYAAASAGPRPRRSLRASCSSRRSSAVCRSGSASTTTTAFRSGSGSDRHGLARRQPPM